MKNLMRKAMLAVGLAGLALTAAQASTVTIKLHLTFDDLGITQGNPLVFDKNTQPYSAISPNPPPAAGVFLTSSGGDPTADIYTPPSPQGGASLSFLTDLTFSVVPAADSIKSIEFSMLAGLTDVTDDGGSLNQSFFCGGPDLWCGSGSIDLHSNAKSVTLKGSGTLIDDVFITIEHQAFDGTVPEPASAALALIALTGAGVASRRRQASACGSR